MGHSIYLADDEKSIRELLHSFLASDGYTVRSFESGDALLEAFRQEPAELVILDIMMPGTDGLAVCRELRSVSDIPIILLTAKDSELDYVMGISQGSDDYLTKPFGTVELLARIRTALRHTRKACGGEELREGQYIVGNLIIDYNKHRAYLDGEDAGLTPSEFKILALLGRYAGRVLTYQQMLRELWGPAANPRDNKLLRVHMANLRRKLEKNPEEPRYLFTEVGVGYRLAEGEGTEPLESDSTEETEE